ncbi:MAG: aminotransferase class I/II-fold pyridoxal phosphate-dependent enzyme [Clostridia bacterium]|nr:aminotransferase class I/II-fold pyridoxal phosphate-dependent enzyme [Clostridia bacterium]
MELIRSENLAPVHSDIRGPLYIESQRMLKEGPKVLRLNTGNPATFGFGMPDSVKKALFENADRAVAYSDLKGMIDAREAICAYHKGKGVQEITPDDIYIGNGVSELVLMALLALLNKGDEVLMPSPSYSLWSNSTYIAGGKPVFYTCDESNLWYPDIDDIKSKVSAKTKAIVIINPNNPTGAIYPKEVLEDIIQVARENDLLIFSDEIYDRLIMDGVEHYSTAALAPDRMVITMNGLSKSHIICGFRCGWMCISGYKGKAEDYIEGIFQMAAMRLCPNTLTQLVIPAALADDASTQAMMVPGGRIYEQREATIREIEKIDGLTCVKNHGAFYVFPKLDVKKFNITNDKKFAFDLLHEKHIFIVPGSGFDWNTPDHFRIVMLPEPNEMAQAMRDIGDFLDHYWQEND